MRTANPARMRRRITRLQDLQRYLDQLSYRGILLDDADFDCIMLGATLGLNEFHRHGHQHGDINEENILVGHDYRVRWSDLRAARVVSGESDRGASAYADDVTCLFALG